MGRGLRASFSVSVKGNVLAGRGKVAVGTKGGVRSFGVLIEVLTRGAEGVDSFLNGVLLQKSFMEVLILARESIDGLGGGVESRISASGERLTTFSRNPFSPSSLCFSI